MNDQTDIPLPGSSETDSLETDTAEAGSGMAEAEFSSPVHTDDPDYAETLPVVGSATGDGARRGPGWLPVVVLSALAAGSGAVGGYALADADPLGGLGPDDRMAAVQSSLRNLEQTDEALRGQLAELERAPRPDARLDALDERLTTLEDRPAPASPGDTVDPDVVDQLRTRLDALEDSLADMEAPSPASLPATSRRLRALEARLDALEAAPDPIAPPLPTPTVSYSVDTARLEVSDTVAPRSGADSGTATTASVSRTAAATPLPPFPYALVDAALDEPPNGNFFSRIVRVRDADAQAALSDLEDALGSKDISAALRAFEKLPTRAKEAASDWAAAARKQAARKTVETQ